MLQEPEPPGLREPVPQEPVARLESPPWLARGLGQQPAHQASQEQRPGQAQQVRVPQEKVRESQARQEPGLAWQERERGPEFRSLA